ncbi:hypothetical protein NL676_002027 [Syzygium grande]|nr:hypothetical protein NL676_002027 [Syzygium grande]
MPMKTLASHVGIGFLAAFVLALCPLDADATRVEYYTTVSEPTCELSFAYFGLGFYDVAVGSGEEVPCGELVNVSELIGFVISIWLGLYLHYGGKAN